MKSLDSSVPVQLTRLSAGSFKPFCSPDGRRIYFVYQGDLWFVGASGGAPEVLVKGVRLAAVSPNGKELAFYRFVQGQVSLWLHSIERGDSREYKRPPFPQSFRSGKGLAFSPDGRILLAGVEDQIGLVSSLDVWILPIPEGTPHRVPAQIPRSDRMSDFSWLPDNRHV